LKRTLNTYNRFCDTIGFEIVKKANDEKDEHSIGGVSAGLFFSLLLNVVMVLDKQEKAFRIVQRVCPLQE
jgi:hypothetical protein